MINIKLFEIISTFSEEDWDNFTLFIKASDAISGRKYLPLVMELKKFDTRLEELKKIPATEIFKKAYNKTFSTQTVNPRQSELLTLLKKFLENNAFDKNELNRTLLYFEELINRKLQNIFPGEYDKKKNLLEENFFDADSYDFISQIILTKANYFELKRDKNNCAKEFFEHSKVLLANILNNLFVNGRIFLIYEYYNVKFEDNPLLKFIDSFASEKYFEELEESNDPIFLIPLIRYYILKSFQHPEVKKYIAKVKKIFFRNEKKFNNNFRVQVYDMIADYHNIKVNNGELSYFKDQFLLYKKKLKNNLVEDIKHRRSINASIFREYILTGIQVKEFKWVEMVIKKYSHLLPEDVREEEYILALIRLHFAKKEFEKVIEITDSTKIKNPIHYLDSVRMKLASFYELKKYEECFLGIDRTKHYLMNNKEKTSGIAYGIKQYQKFIDVFLKLLNYKTNPFNRDINNVLFEVEKSNFFMKDWISEKVKELMDNIKT
jgi:hypothetical protein